MLQKKFRWGSPSHNTSKQLEVINESAVIPLEITEELKNKIKFLCNKINTVEWSGILFYKMDGTIRDPENLKLTAVDVLPMDKGDSTFTEYTLDDRFTDYLMEKPERMDLLIGHIHSHHSMDVFFSGTDQAELHDNSQAHNFYLSVIVNNFGEVTAKVATKGHLSISKAELPIKCLDENGEEYEIGLTKSIEFDQNYVREFTCDITMEPYGIDVPEDFIGKVEDLCKPKMYSAPKKSFHGVTTEDVSFFNKTYNAPVNSEEDIVTEDLIKILCSTEGKALNIEICAETLDEVFAMMQSNPVRIAKLFALAIEGVYQRSKFDSDMGSYLELIEEILSDYENAYSEAIRNVIFQMT